jgi:hypothetical protein
VPPGAAGDFGFAVLLTGTRIVLSCGSVIRFPFFMCGHETAHRLDSAIIAPDGG